MIAMRTSVAIKRVSKNGVLKTNGFHLGRFPATLNVSVLASPPLSRSLSLERRESSGSDIFADLGLFGRLDIPAVCLEYLQQVQLSVLPTIATKHTHTPVGSIGDTGIYVNCDEFPEVDLAKFAIVNSRSVGRREKKSNAREKKRKEKTSGRQTVEFARRWNLRRTHDS